jgi:quinol monooxygenase YgiN
MIQVLAFITAQPGKRDEVLAAFRDNVAAVRAEDGCIEYQAMVDADGLPGWAAAFGPDTFVVVEKWRDMAALQAHAAAPHMAAYGKRTRPLLADRKIHILGAAA